MNRQELQYGSSDSIVTPKKKPRGRPPKHKSQPCSLDDAKEDTRVQFEQQQKRIIAACPDYIKEMFGKVCFAKFGKAWYPVLVLYPYHVPPGAVRNAWLEMFERVSDICLCFV
jgi:hypothetical protein